MKHAYLFTANGNLKVLASCLRMLDYPSNDIYIIFDRKSSRNIDLLKSLLSKIEKADVKYLGLKTVNWGYSQVDAVMDLIDSAIESGVDYQYLHFLQNSDLPIKSNCDILQFFDEHNGEEFVNVERKSSAWAEKCCQYRYLLSHNRFYRKSKIIKGINLCIARLQRMIGIRINEDIPLYYGSALFSITLSFAKYMSERREEIEHRFRWALAPDEKFIQTMLMNSPFSEKVANSESCSTSNAVLIDWKRSRAKNSPHVWRSDEFDFILSCSAKYCFARKFMENVDIEIVQRIENHFLQS